MSLDNVKQEVTEIHD